LTGANNAPKAPLWRQSKVELILVVLGVAAIGYGLIYQTPNAIPDTVSERLTTNFPSDNITVTGSNGQNYTFLTPHISYLVEITFNAQGSFSADNPITIHVVIYNANNSVTEYYCCIAFWGAVPASNPSDFADNWFYLNDMGNGNYTADGVLEWPQGGATYDWLWPNMPQGVTSAAYHLDFSFITFNNQRSPTLTIGPSSDTLAWQSAQQNIKNGWITLGVLVIGPYEVVKRLSGRREEHQQ
jgi:hypothetical protein